MSEWTNPIFYLNLAGLVLALVLLKRGGHARGVRAALVVLAIGTGAHFIGDLFGASEDLDHVFIHGVVALALAMPVALK